MHEQGNLRKDHPIGNVSDCRPEYGRWHVAGGVIAYRTGLYGEEKYGFQQVQLFAVGCPKFHLRDIPYNDRFTDITGQNPDRIAQAGF